MNTDDHKLKTTQSRSKLTVLVEELPLVRKIWEIYHEERGLRLEVFENPMDFLRQIDRFTDRDEEIHFFFDQDFGVIRGVGLELARAVRSRNSLQTVSLVTYYTESLFQKEIRDGLIDSVFEKYPRVVFGGNFPNSGTFTDPSVSSLIGSPFGKASALEVELGTGQASSQFTLERYFPSLAPGPKLDFSHFLRREVTDEATSFRSDASVHDLDGSVFERYWADGSPARVSVASHVDKSEAESSGLRKGTFSLKEFGAFVLGVLEVRGAGLGMDFQWGPFANPSSRPFWEGLLECFAFFTFLLGTRFIFRLARMYEKMGDLSAALGPAFRYVTAAATIFGSCYLLLPAFKTDLGQLGLVCTAALAICPFFLQPDFFRPSSSGTAVSQIQTKEEK